MTDENGYYSWENLAWNTIYCFVVEVPGGYYPAWVLAVEGKYYWNNTRALAKE